MWLWSFVVAAWSASAHAGCDTVSAAAPAEIELSRRRVALVVGNGGYQAPGAALSAPPRDADAMAASLSAVGFEVTRCVDLGRAEMVRAIQSFGDELSPGTVAMFYYSGHGAQARDANWLVPIDARIDSVADVELEAVSLDVVLRRTQGGAAGLSIIVLDACRNNPFGRGSKSIGGQGKGLTPVSAASAGTFIGFATAPGDIALDGESSLSPYTASLSQQLRRPGLELHKVFRNTRAEVLAATGGAQTPWENTSLLEDFYFLPGDLPDDAVPDRAPIPTGAVAPRPSDPAPAPAASPPPVAAAQGGVGTLYVRGSPDDGEVYIDGRPAGQTMWRGDLPAGSHVVELRSPGGRTASSTIVVRPGRDTYLCLDTQRDRVCR